MNSLFSRDKDFAEIYDKHIEMIYRICYLMLKNKADAEDAASTVFVRLLNAKKEFKSEEHIKAYLIVTAKNTCKNYLSSYYFKNISLLTSDVSIKEETNEILREIMLLPSKYKIVIYMYYYEGYSSLEISKILSKNESTIRTWLMIGREKLKERIGGTYGEKNI